MTGATNFRPLYVTREQANPAGRDVSTHTVRSQPVGFPVAVLKNFGREEREAYACLFAAAPELLDALTAFMSNAGLSHIDRDDSRFDRARAAIAKATGVAR